ncbi:MAG: HAD hydrolase family protein [Nitrososphaerota archaeon]|jgi:hydroxymethylpyrimidine pyrophosphatase-like HAD family hydrolase|nr:HAD hydrolase family protein [Nitrososphaerota archaeon]
MIPSNRTKNCPKNGNWSPIHSVLATDLDGTMKKKGEPISQEVLREVSRLKKIGVGLILVTGRCAKEQQEVIDRSEFDAVVLENGAVIETTKSAKRVVISVPWWADVRSRVGNQFTLGCEEVIVSLPREYGPSLEDFDFGAPVKLMYNRDRVMVLPPGVDKGRGLRLALKELGWEGRCIACIGDGENDVDLLLTGDIGLAVANAVQELRATAQMTAQLEDGLGWTELTRRLFPGT